MVYFLVELSELLNYNNYIILFKQGNFYYSINYDALVLNRIFNYKVNVVSDFIKVGFPLKTIDKVIPVLEEKNVNYIIIDKEVIEKKKYPNNEYFDYLNVDSNYEFVLNRINKIDKTLKDNLLNSNIEAVLNDIERIVCKINYR